MNCNRHASGFEYFILLSVVLPSFLFLLPLRSFALFTTYLLGTS